MDNEFKIYLESMGLTDDDSTRSEFEETAFRVVISRPKSLNIEERTVEVVLSTTDVALMPDFKRREMVDEILVMSGMTVRGNTNKVPMQKDHSRKIDDNVGSIIDIKVQGNEVIGKAVFSKTEEKIFIKVAEGHVDSLSAGYLVTKKVYIPAGNSKRINGIMYKAGKRTLKVVLEWVIKEGSLVVIGANTGTSTRAEHEGPPICNTNNKNNTNEGVQEMDAELKKILFSLGLDENATEEETRSFHDSLDLSKIGIVVDSEDNTPDESDNKDSKRSESDSSDSNRSEFVNPAQQRLNDELQDKLDKLNQRDAEEEIRSAFEPFEFYGEDLTKLRDKCLKDGDVSDSHRHLTEFLAANDKPTGRSHVYSNGPGERESFCANASLGLQLRCGKTFEDEDEQKRAEYGQTLSLLHLAEDCLEREGNDIKGWDRLQLTQRALSTTADFPNILEDSVNKSLDEGYVDAPQTWRAWTKKRSLNDFKIHKITKLSQAGVLPLVKDGNPIPQYGLSDSKELMSLLTYAKEITITRHTIINDDLDAFRDIPLMHARAYARTINQLAVYILLNNGQLTDAVALFHATHNNLVTGNIPTTVALARTIIQNMATKLRQQKDLDGTSFLQLPPAVVLAGTNYEFVLREAMFETKKAEGNTPNGIVNLNLQLAIEAVLDADNSEEGITGTPDSLYMFANPLDAPVVSVGFLDGKDAPRLDQKDGWSIEGISFKVAGDIGVAATDHRGAVKSQAS